MTGASSRRRGHSWEREVARDLSSISGVEMERVLNESRDGNCGDVTGSIPFVIQCKTGKRIGVRKALEEAIEAAGEGQHPIAAIRYASGRGRPAFRFACVPWEDFVEMVETLKACGAW